MRHQLYVLRSSEQTTVKARQLRVHSHRAESEFCLSFLKLFQLERDIQFLVESIC